MKVLRKLVSQGEDDSKVTETEETLIDKEGEEQRVRKRDVDLKLLGEVWDTVLCCDNHEVRYSKLFDNE